MTSVICIEYASSAVPVAYVAGSLDPARTEAFEVHMIGCAECQEAVRLAAGMRAALPDAGPNVRRLNWPVRVLAGVAAAILLLVGGATWKRRIDLGALGAVPALPRYEGIEVRSSQAAADSLFAAGMRAYVDGRNDAATLLGEARAQGADPAATSFFRGVLALHDGRARDAAELLGESAQLASPYRDEANLYLAKAQLRLGDADGALEALDRVGSAQAPVAAHARALGDSVRSLRR